MKADEKVPCKTCGRSALESTVNKTGGYCMQCARKAGVLPKKSFFRRTPEKTRSSLEPTPSQLISCKTCGGKVSNTAPSCPHCGESMPGNRIKCPRCSSQKIEAGTKGFGLGKAVVGAAVLGPGGLLAGLHGRKNTELHCQACGKRWTPSN
jgi:hypothetical protein